MTLNLNRFLLSVTIVSALALIVLASIVADALPALIAGVIVLGLISIGLATVGVNLFSRYTDAQHKMRSLQYSHIETMAAKGFLPAGAKYEPARLPEPDDVRISTQGATARTVAPYHEEAVNLLALSLQWHRQARRKDPLQIITWREAEKHEYFAGNFELYHQACQYLIVNMLAAQRMNGRKNEGTFITSGTLEQAYQRLSGKPPLLA